MNADTDLYAELTSLTNSAWRCRFEVDDYGKWWLTVDGYRRRNPWRPQDEVDMLLGVALLYILNGAHSKFSIPAEYEQMLKDNHRSAAVLRGRLMYAALKLHRQLVYGPPPIIP